MVIVIPNSEMIERFFSKIRKKTSLPTLITLNQHATGSPRASRQDKEIMII